MVEASSAALGSVSARLDPAAAKLAVARGDALRQVQAVLDILAEPSGTAGDEEKQQPQQAPSARLTCLTRAMAQLQATAGKLKKAHANEDISKISELVDKATTQAKEMATTAVAKIQEDAATFVSDLVAMADGVGQDPGLCWYIKLAAGHTWEECKEVAAVTLLPLDASLLKKKLEEAVEIAKSYDEIASKHKLAGAAWDAMELALKKARTTQVCHTLVAAFTSSNDLKHLRKLTKEETAKLKRFGEVLGNLPSGLQKRMAAAMKGQTL